MNHAIDPDAPKAEQTQMPERIASEPDFSHRWITSTQPHWKGLVQVRYEHVKNLQTVLFNSGADTQMRRNALRQLQTNVTQRDCEDSRAVLAQWTELGLTLD